MGNETYNYDVIRERLSMTSFKSVEEFVQEVEKTYYLAKALAKKYPELKEASPEFQEKIKGEHFKKMKLSHRETRGSKENKKRCDEEAEVCHEAVATSWITAQALCLIWSFSPPTLAYCTLTVGATGIIGANACSKMHKVCLKHIND